MSLSFCAYLIIIRATECLALQMMQTKLQLLHSYYNSAVHTCVKGLFILNRGLQIFTCQNTILYDGKPFWVVFFRYRKYLLILDVFEGYTSQLRLYQLSVNNDWGVDEWADWDLITTTNASTSLESWLNYPFFLHLAGHQHWITIVSQFRCASDRNKPSALALTSRKVL